MPWDHRKEMGKVHNNQHEEIRIFTQRIEQLLFGVSTSMTQSDQGEILKEMSFFTCLVLQRVWPTPQGVVLSTARPLPEPCSSHELSGVSAPHGPTSRFYMFSTFLSLNNPFKNAAFQRT